MLSVSARILVNQGEGTEEQLCGTLRPKYKPYKKSKCDFPIIFYRLDSTEFGIMPDDKELTFSGGCVCVDMWTCSVQSSLCEWPLLAIVGH